jgi:RND superfamily putative drug exporter
LVLLAWVGVGGVGGPLVGRLSEVQENDQANFLPADAESTRVAGLSARFSGADTLPFVVVVEGDRALTPTDQAAVQRYVAAVPTLRLPGEPQGGTGSDAYRLASYLAPGPTVAVPSQDGRAALVSVAVRAKSAGDTLPDGTSVVLGVAEALRAQAATDLARPGTRAYVTGPGGLTADLVTAFGGIDGRLLGVALIAVFLILLLVYRSPVLPFAALLTAVLGLSAAALAVFPLARDGVIDLNGQSQGILSILVIGAATDYALLLVARYREELHGTTSKYTAMRRAWRRAVEPIAASAATVVLGLLCLLLSELGSTRGLGPVGALGIAGALLAALTFLPVLLLWPVVVVGLLGLGVVGAVGAALGGPSVAGALVGGALAVGVGLGVLRRRALARAGRGAEGSLDAGAGGSAGRALPWYARPASGRWLFWPRVPHPDRLATAGDAPVGSGWRRLAALVGRRPRAVWVATLGLLLAAAAFAPSLRAEGISQTDIFRTDVESVAGTEALVRHFPGGSGSPAVLVVPEQEADRALELARGVPGVNRADLTATRSPSGQPESPRVIDGQVQVEATLAVAADSPEAEQVVRRLRSVVDQVSTDVLVGGSTAVNLDVREASERDLAVVLPAILVVILLVLVVLLRSLVAPVLLVLANVLSFAATLGVSALVFNHVLDFPGGDPAIPLFAFVFLVALGIDYSIFLMTRVREESLHRSPRPGMLTGLAVTGGVITSAGVVLAATFGALGTVPILFLQQIAFIVAFGVLLDTLVVRSLLVPALGYDLGRGTWWPSALARRADPVPSRGSAAATGAAARRGSAVASEAAPASGRAPVSPVDGGL